MTKKIVENISKALPASIKNIIDYLKENFDEHGQTVLQNTGGTAGVLISLFAQPAIDRYFESLAGKKLDNFGFNLYLKASLTIARQSLELVADKLDSSLDSTLVFEILKRTVNEESEQVKKERPIFIFQPQYHPVVVLTKNNYVRVLREINAPPNEIKLFLKNFNSNIEAAIVSEFGHDYETHLKKIRKYLLEENETIFLWDTIQKGKIGFKDFEDLNYVETFGTWKPVGDLQLSSWIDSEIDYEKLNRSSSKKDVAKIEKTLKPIESLIEEYFNRNPNNNLNEILFIIADFGKGKSVFLRHYAATLARKYLESREGFFPIYFNLRNYKNFSSEPRLGVISDYLETNYSIKIDEPYFQKKKYVFLIDSLDESGELNKQAIDKVIASVKKIQNINKQLYKTNRLIITSRPFDEGLKYQLEENLPYTQPNKEGRDIPCFINIYGFTKNQFNHWLYEALEEYSGLGTIKTTGFASQIVSAIKRGERIDIYDRLLTSKTLSQSELRRPIFAYMIYQLIINNVDFLSVGKLGVYLSFLNLLTKEAKHIHDVNFKVNLKEEFEFRNILHITSALWMYERQRGKQGMLKKADICRALEEKDLAESDDEVLSRFTGQGFTEIQFLSHSYFGENDNVLHFQHQSFAEILAAEYYLKIFVKYALDENVDIEEARLKLTLGEPTEQTVIFLKEMLQVLRESCTNEVNDQILEKRKLLFPLFASLATLKHNRLFCNELYYSWYKHCTFSENQVEYPHDSIKNWCIDQSKLDKIITLSAEIISSKKTYLPVLSTKETSLFSPDILSISNPNFNSTPQNIDQWLALLVGNVLYNDLSNITSPKLFNCERKVLPIRLFDLIKSRNFSHNESSPKWGRDLFMGIEIEGGKSQYDLTHYNFDGLNFSYSKLFDITCWHANWSRCKLDYCTFHNVSFVTCTFFSTSIQNIKKISGRFRMSNCDVTTKLKILDAFNTVDMARPTHKFENNEPAYNYISSYDLKEMQAIIGFMEYGVKNGFLTLKIIKGLFRFDNAETKKKFNEAINELKGLEKKQASKPIRVPKK